MADKIVAEYTVKVDKALKDLNKLAARVNKIDDERKKVQNGFKDMSKGMAADFKKVGAAIGLAFGAQEIISFGKEAVKLAAQMEGVERAFKRIGGANSANLLDGLRKATRGTVSDLQLMQKAVQASNFKIPLENLASLFKFAQARARETGESVEYLTNSIVLGIGRKSPLILDNLGISAVELRERLKGVGVEASSVGDIARIIGEIAEEELAKMGDQADTTADKIEQISAAFENIKNAIGGELINQINGFVDEMSTTEEKITKLTGATDKFSIISFFAGNVMKAILEPFRAVNDIVNKSIDIYNLASKSLKILTDELQEAAYRLTLNNEELIEFNKLGEASKKIIVDQWLGLKDYSDFADDAAKATELFNKQIADKPKEEIITQEVIKNLAHYNKLIKDLQAKQADANTTRERVRQLEDEINEAIRQRLILLGKLREVGSGDEERFDLVRGTAARMTDAEFDAAKKSLVIQEDLTDDILEDADRRNAGLIAKGQDLVSAQRALQEHITKDQEEQEQIREMLSFAAVDGLISIVGSVAQIQNNLIQDELNDLQAALENGSITREEFEDRRKQLLREQAENQKSAALFQATIDGAAAVVATFRTDPTGILAAIVGATVAANIAAIASQPLPEFAEGGFVNEHGEIRGRSHKQGGVKIEAEGGEFITSAKHAKQNADILKAINSGQWEKYKMENIIAPAINQVLEGGFENMGASYSLQNNFNDKNLLRAIDRHRTSDKDGFVFLAQELKRLKPRKRGGFA